MTIAGPPQIVKNEDGSFSGPYTHDLSLEVGKEIIPLTATQFSALDALRRANPGAALAFDGANFTLAPAEIARRQQRQAQRALLDKLAADTITAAELRDLVKHFARRIRELEKRFNAIDE